jgi:twitching motility protein PilT
MSGTDLRSVWEGMLATCVELGASDMHLTGGSPISYRVHGKLLRHGAEVFPVDMVASLAECIMTDRQRQDFASRFTLDLGYSSAAGERFRVNCYREMGRTALAVRHLDQRLLTFEELGLPVRLRELARLKSGLVLVTGATGSGKSSTLAVLLNEINQTRDCHILTVEDPVEFVHTSRKSLIHHREVHTDVPSYAEAMWSALREDPDVIMLGEMRDLETMQAAIAAAETGHLVFSTLHTGEAVGAVERFIGHFSGEEQAVARHRIAMVLKAVIAQRLVPKKDGEGRVPAVELLMVNTAAANLIQSSKTRQLYSLMEAGAKDGMWTLDQDLARLVKGGKISLEEAVRICNDGAGFNRLVDAAPRGGR